MGGRRGALVSLGLFVGALDSKHEVICTQERAQCCHEQVPSGACMASASTRQPTRHNSSGRVYTCLANHCYNISLLSV